MSSPYLTKGGGFSYIPKAYRNTKDDIWLYIEQQS